MSDHPNQPKPASYGRTPSDAERIYIESVAQTLFAAFPEGIKPSQMIGALTLMLGTAFNGLIQPQYRLAAFDEAVATMRKAIEEEVGK